MRKDDLTGTELGTVTVTGDSGQRQRGVILWNCRCGRCGENFLATRNQLLSTRFHTCEPRAPAPGRPDLTGMQFGDLTVLRRAENDPFGHTRWLCRCRCGKETTVLGSNLRDGKTRSCGCRQYAGFRGKDLTGQRFGRLTALHPVPGRGSNGSKWWRCRCDCGQETEKSARQLLNGRGQNCGCLPRELRSDVQDHLHYENGTCLERLERAKNTTGENQTGFRGLYLTRRGTYRASITFMKRHYTLGYYETYGAAVQARLDAEESLHVGYLAASERYRIRAESDPAWAESNRFYYNVVRTGGTFQVSTNGV